MGDVIMQQNKTLFDHVQHEGKKCKDCKEWKPYSEFYRRGRGQRGNARYQIFCKECHKTRKYQWVKEHPDRIKETRHKRRHKTRAERLRREYGMTVEQYEALLESQDGKCAICGTKEPGRHGNFYVDHCHATGRVRGALCNKCNIALGLFNDDLQLLDTAIDYLKKHGS